QKEGIHRALEADMQFADLTLGKGEEAHAGKSQPLQETSDILLVARQPVERLGDDDVELAASGIIEKRLIGRAQGAGTAHGPVRVGMEVFPAFLRDPLPTQPDLVLD